MTAFARFMLLFIVLAVPERTTAEQMRFGFAKLDITPDRPVRLSGYGSRQLPFEGVQQKLYARAMAIESADGDRFVLASADCIGFSGSLVTKIAHRVEEKFGVPRERFVLCATHSHCAPHLSGYLTNIFNKPLTDEESAETRRYTKLFADRILEAAGAAIADLSPGRLYWGEGEVGFANNRRVIRNGKWTGFGVNEEGPVDHTLPVLKIVGPNGRLRGIVFGYACHCTTLGGKFNQVSGDWAGFGQLQIEDRHPGAVAIATIGCGGDANPNPRGELEMAKIHGRAISLEVDRVIADSMRPVTDPPRTAFGFAALPLERPTRSELEQRLEDSDLRERRRAEHLLNIYKLKGRLPATHPCPVQVWRFGDELTMIFLGGEVVVDYALRLKREIESGGLWVTAYANDVFGYVASERLREEGGYEVDRSMLYYNLSGRFESPAEEILIRRVHDLFGHPGAEKALATQKALESFRLPTGFDIELVAAEPLVTDPINIAFGDHGELWVVEMGDYPLGLDGAGSPGGKIKKLQDTDGDGTFDRSTVFLDGIFFPSGVMPWRDGVLITAAPKIFYAEDTDGDGRADSQKILFEGFSEANPQHRIHGFSYGLDNWVYIGGDNGGKILSTQTKEILELSGRDARIRPDEGIIEPVSGRSQYIRSRDDWGNWFGGSNSRPLAHYVLADHYVRRNPHAAGPDPRVELVVSMPVFPASRTLERFNDLFATNRFTSACSPVIYRDERFGPEFVRSAFVCEPVHNLVHRTVLAPDGVTFSASRHPAEQSSEFLASTDVWSRPVRVLTGPDGALWVVDMYRYVIEHPRWIPGEWQTRLDLRAGDDKGRIYRVFPKGRVPHSEFRIPHSREALATLSTTELVARLKSPNGWQRDTAQRLLVHRADSDAAPLIEKLAAQGKRPTARLHALCTLEGLGALRPRTIEKSLSDPHPGVRRRAVLLSEPMLNDHPELTQKLVQLIADSDLGVRYQVALSLGEWDDPRAGEALGRLAAANSGEPWIRAAVLTSATRYAELILKSLLARSEPSGPRSKMIDRLFDTVLGSSGIAGLEGVLPLILPEPSGEIEIWQLRTLAGLIDSLERFELRFENGTENDELRLWLPRIHKVFRVARSLAFQGDAPLSDRTVAIRLLGRALDQKPKILELLAGFLVPQIAPSLQSAALEALVRLRIPEVSQRLIEGWQTYAPDLRSEVLDVLLSRRAWTEDLLDALETEKILPMDLDASRRRRLLEHRNDDLRTRAVTVLAAAIPQSRLEVIESYRSVLESPGNPFRGIEVFEKHCAACHRYHQRGTDVGADLASLTDKTSESLLTAILDPNRAVESKFRNYIVAMTDGRILSGMIVAQTATSITLALPNGTRQDILRVDLDELLATDKSFMPEGLEKDFSSQDLADLIAFLQSKSNPHR